MNTEHTSAILGLRVPAMDVIESLNGVPAPPEIKPRDTSSIQVTPEAIPDDVRRQQVLFKIFRVISFVCIAGAVSFTGAVNSLAAIGISAAICLLIESPKFFTEMMRRHQERQSVRFEFLKTFQNLNVTFGPPAFEKRMLDLKALATEYENLPGDCERQVERFVSTAKNTQLAQHMAATLIATAIIPGIGDVKKKSLAVAGMVSAFDVNRQGLQSLAGFGEASIDSVMQWKSGCEAEFVFNETALAGSTLSIRQKFADRQRVIEGRLQNALNELTAYQSELAVNGKAAIAATEVLCRSLAQKNANITLDSFSARQLRRLLGCFGKYGGDVDSSTDLAYAGSAVHAKSEPFLNRIWNAFVGGLFGCLFGLVFLIASLALVRNSSSLGIAVALLVGFFSPVYGLYRGYKKGLPWREASKKSDG